MSAQGGKKSAVVRHRIGTVAPDDGVCLPRASAKAVAHVGFVTVGEIGLLVVVLRYSRAAWAQWVDFNVSTAVFGRALIHATDHFGGAPRRWLFEEPDCRVLHWDGRREHFAELLQVITKQMASSLGVWHERYRGPAITAAERLIWATPCPSRLGLPAANAALHVLLTETVPHWPHPRQPGRSIAEMFVEERGRLLPVPDSLAALDIWFEMEKGDDVSPT